jgi:hypothetical protein
MKMQNHDITDLPTTTEAETIGLTKPVEKKDTRARAWMLTIRESDGEQQELEQKLERYTAYVGQLEEGTKTGYRHWQLYLENENPIRFSALKSLFPTAHIEMRRGTAAQCVAYCSKEESRVGAQISKGIIDTETTQGQRTDLEEMRERIVNGERASDLIFSDSRAMRHSAMLMQLQNMVDEREFGSRPREVQAHYIWGKTGVGKTSAIYESHGWDARVLYQISDYSARSNPWDGYSAHDVVVFDEFSSQWRIEMMLRLLDRYPFTLPARYSNRAAAWSTVYLLSNESFQQQYREENPEKRRAFRRRFASIGEMKADGTIEYERRGGVDLDLVETESRASVFGLTSTEV